jgi:hypothetical protein
MLATSLVTSRESQVLLQIAIPKPQNQLNHGAKSHGNFRSAMFRGDFLSTLLTLGTP